MRGTVLALILVGGPALAGPFVAPDDLRMRLDLQLLVDTRAINVPLTTWPLAWGDVANALRDVDVVHLGSPELVAYQRVSRAMHLATRTGENTFGLAISAAVEPRVIRSFDNTPREQGELRAGFAWTGNRFAVQARAAWVADPADGENLRPDGSYAAMALGNWIVSAGWQERWWGPGHDGSLLLSTNARPVPALAIQRNQSTTFDTRWLRWMGPWTLSAFMGVLDDDRVIDDTLLFGLRAGFRPAPGLEIGFARTAQWCGADRPCDGSTFVDLLLGNDNPGINVDPNAEPGNQLGGFDLRWSLPRGYPFAFYAQWIAEDTRRGGPEIGSWLRQAGIEYRRAVSGSSLNMHVEVAETSCRDGGLGFSELDPDCGYEHGIYATGYRYRGRSLGHGMDSDGLSYSFGSTLVQSAGHSWSILMRYLEINREGAPGARHTLAATPQTRYDLQLRHEREFAGGNLHFGIGFRHSDDDLLNSTERDVTGFVGWSSM